MVCMTEFKIVVFIVLYFFVVVNGNTNILYYCCCFCNIYILYRCVYELFVAQTLKVKVTLCPHVSDEYVTWGYLEYDVCINNIKNNVDSENAFCSNESDKQAIHNAILQSSPNGFKTIDKIVETFRSDYALYYQVHKIIGRDRDLYWLILRYITILVYPFIIGMMILYPFGFHLCPVMLPLIGLVLNLLVKFIDNEELTWRWKIYTEGKSFHQGYVRDILYRPISLIFSNKCRESRKKADKDLADAIVVIVKRAHSLDDNEIPSYEDHCKYWS